MKIADPTVLFLRQYLPNRGHSWNPRNPGGQLVRHYAAVPAMGKMADVWEMVSFATLTQTRLILDQFCSHRILKVGWKICLVITVVKSGLRVETKPVQWMWTVNPMVRLLGWRNYYGGVSIGCKTKVVPEGFDEGGSETVKETWEATNKQTCVQILGSLLR